MTQARKTFPTKGHPKNFYDAYFKSCFTKKKESTMKSKWQLNAMYLLGFLSLPVLTGCERSASSSTKLPVEQATQITPSQPVPTTPTASNDPPPEAVIKEKLERDMWGPASQGGTVHTYQYKSLKIAPSRLGDSWTDGVPANLRTNVHGVKVVVDVTRNFTDGTSKQETKDQTYVFFKDEFGDWTYRFVQNNS
jgi:hypothetical protein